MSCRTRRRGAHGSQIWNSARQAAARRLNNPSIRGYPPRPGPARALPASRSPQEQTSRPRREPRRGAAAPACGDRPLGRSRSAAYCERPLARHAHALVRLTALTEYSAAGSITVRGNLTDRQTPAGARPVPARPCVAVAGPADQIPIATMADTLITRRKDRMDASSSDRRSISRYVTEHVRSCHTAGLVTAERTYPLSPVQLAWPRTNSVPCALTPPSTTSSTTATSGAADGTQSPKTQKAPLPWGVGVKGLSADKASLRDSAPTSQLYRRTCERSPRSPSSPPSLRPQLDHGRTKPCIRMQRHASD